jgi:hypothetical protein
MTTKEQRQRAAAKQCREMSDEELLTLIAQPGRRITKTLREVARAMLAHRERERRRRAYEEEQKRLRKLSTEALWVEVTANGPDSRRAANEWKRRERRERLAAIRKNELQREGERGAARQAVEHWTTEELLAFQPNAATTHVEVDGVMEELWQRKLMIERKYSQLQHASWKDRNRPYRLKDASAAEPKLLPGLTPAGRP